MDGILVLLALAVLAVPIGVILLWIGQANLRRRVGELERELAKVTGGVAIAPLPEVTPVPDTSAPEAATEPAPRSTMAEAAVPPAVAAPEPAAPSGPLSPWDRAMARASAGADAQAPTGPVPDQNQPLVIRADRFAALMRWLRENWVYAVSALSLALAGVFFVQYGVERGLLAPPVRVALAVVFGLALIGAGEWIRRRWGDEGDTASAHLPSVFSGAGLVSIFAGITAGRLMYDLYSAGLTFAGLLVTAATAIGLGWRHGPLLVAIGLLGASAAPFLVAGGTAPAPWLYAYYALVAATGLGVDAIRRWAWVSVLALVLGYGGGWLMMQSGAGGGGWLLFLLLLPPIATALPQLSLIPGHEGPATLLALWRRNGTWPAFPVRLAFGAVLASSALMLIHEAWTTEEAMLAFAFLAALALMLMIWAWQAEGLADLAIFPIAAFLVKLGIEMPLIRAFRMQAIALREPETAAPLTISLLLAMATLLTAAAAWRAFSGIRFRKGYALLAVLTAPVAALVIELAWAPSPVLGAYPWALHVIALAALMTALAVGFARADGEDRRRAAWATLSALSLIALALFLITTQAALTLALAALIVVAAALDRRFALPEMGWFIQLGCAVISYRLIVDPGFEWALYAPLTPVLLSFAGSVAGAAVAWWLLPEGRRVARGVLESAGLAFAALLANVLITRALLPPEDSYGPYWGESHWGIVLNAMPWLVLMLVQLYRLPLAGKIRRLRGALAILAGFLGFAGLAYAVGPANPLFSTYPDQTEMLTRGPRILDSLALAYALPGLMLIGAALRIPLPWRLKPIFLGIGAALLVLYTGLEIRRFWQGDWLGAPGVKQGELYSYTIAMMLAGAGLLWQAIARRSGTLQRAAMVVIGLTVAKVFLIDAAGLSGLTRVFSFLGLGLSLAGLAWLNRWARGAIMGSSEQ